MGAGASASQVREHVEGLGNAYQPYGTTLEDNGVDGALVEELAHDDRAGVNATFDDLGITNKLHRRKLLQAARAQHGVQPDRPRSGSSIGSSRARPSPSPRTARGRGGRRRGGARRRGSGARRRGRRRRRAGPRSRQI